MTSPVRPCELFVDRAAAMQPAFALTTANRAAIVRLCRHLDGVPLAIELAAARVVARAPDEILAEVSGRLGRLADRRRVVDRHRSMDAVIGWSYDLLEPAGAVAVRTACPSSPAGSPPRPLPA